MAKSNSAGKKPMGSGMQQTTLVARRSVVSPSNGSPKSDQLGLGGKKTGNKKKAPTHKKLCVTPRPGNPKTVLEPACTRARCHPSVCRVAADKNKKQQPIAGKPVACVL